MKYILTLISCLLVFSCGNSRKLKTDLMKLQNSSLIIPQGMIVTYNGLDTVIGDIRESTLKFIVYADSTGCASCGISKMYLWQALLDYAKTFNGKLKFYFIFHPTNINIDKLRSAMILNPINYPMFIDLNRDFEKANPHLPKNKAMHTFLLDENNKVILVGNPLYNKEIEKLFYKITQERLAK